MHDFSPSKSGKIDTASMTNHQLPNPVMLEVIHFCDVSTLKSLRRAHSTFYNLISTYEHSTCTAITGLFYTEDEVRYFKPSCRLNGPLQMLFALDYRLQTAKWLSSVALENHCVPEDEIGYFGNIGASETQGDPIRDQVTIGWSILWQMADLAREVLSEGAGVNIMDAGGRISRATRGHPNMHKLESQVLKRQVQYANSLPWIDKFSYCMLNLCVQSVFGCRVFEDPKSKRFRRGTGREYWRRNSWLNWLVLREGPGFFAQAWASKDGNNECLRHILAEWSGRSEEQLLIERNAAEEVEKALLNVNGEDVCFLEETIRLFYALTRWAREGRLIQRSFSKIPFQLGYWVPSHVAREIDREYYRSIS